MANADDDTLGPHTLGVVKRNIARADRATVDKLSRFGSATIHEATGRAGGPGLDMYRMREPLAKAGLRYID